MNTITLTYIDDFLDPDLTDYLYSYSYPNTTIIYNELEFKSDFSYQQLLKSETVRDSNCIVIDSKLFEEKTATDGKFTGEEFELMLRRVYPYIEVTVVSSKPIEHGYDVVSKWKSGRFSNDTDSAQYYNVTIKEKLDSSIKKVLQYRSIINRIKENSNDLTSEADLINSIDASLNGLFEYEALNSQKIDELVASFESIKRLIDEQ